MSEKTFLVGLGFNCFGISPSDKRSMGRMNKNQLMVTWIVGLWISFVVITTFYGISYLTWLRLVRALVPGVVPALIIGSLLVYTLGKVKRPSILALVYVISAIAFMFILFVWLSCSGVRLENI